MLTFFFAFFLIPETKGMSLEKMDQLFGITDDLLRIVDDDRRERIASRTAEGDIMGLGSLSNATAPAIGRVNFSEKRNMGSSSSRDQSPVYRV